MVATTRKPALIDEVGLTDADFREVPAMYYQTSYGMVSYFPAVQNLLGVGDALFLADPEGPDVDGADIWRDASLDAFAGLATPSVSSTCTGITRAAARFTAARTWSALP